MRYTVVSKPLADLQLGDIWLQAVDRQAVTDASDRVNALLRDNPAQRGKQRTDGRYVIVCAPLSITYEVSEADLKATIVSIRYNTSFNQS
jgi:hypothetical protein